MRIASVEFLGVNVTPKTNWSFLLLRTDDGRTGTGECTLANQEALLEAEAARLAANVAGEDARAKPLHAPNPRELSCGAESSAAKSGHRAGGAMTP